MEVLYIHVYIYQIVIKQHLTLNHLKSEWLQKYERLRMILKMWYIQMVSDISELTSVHTQVTVLN